MNMQTYNNVWNALVDTPEETGNMKIRSSLMMAISKPLKNMHIFLLCPHFLLQTRINIQFAKPTKSTNFGTIRLLFLFLLQAVHYAHQFFLA